MTDGYFKFHSVGQGLFYEGDINLGSYVFRFVYDCGEQRGRGGLPQAIYEYDCRNHNEDIDLFVISHMDFDHFSGIPELLSTHKVKMLVMPYYNLCDLYLMAEQTVKSSLSDAEKQRMLNFCADPNAFFSEHVSRVFLMAGDEEIENPEYERFEYNDLNWDDITFSGFHVSVIHKQSFTVAVKKWEFIFHNRYADPNEIRKYRTSLLSAAGSKDLLKSVMCDITNFRKFVRKVKPFMPQKKSNNNSVILYHGPNINLPQNYFKLCSGERCTCNFSLITVDGFGTLLTGDIVDIENEWSHITNRLTPSRIANIGNFLVPHHGAATCFTCFGFENCIISYGLRNSYGHPNRATLHTIANSSTHLHLVNEHNSYAYRIIEVLP